MSDLLLTSLLIVLSYKILVFLLSISLKRSDVADISWGVSFILVVIVALLYSDPNNITLLLISSLVTVWALRLAIRIALRNRGKKEDFRYRKLREEAGSYFLLRSFFQVFILQGVLAVVVATPILVVSRNPSTLGFLSIFGLAIWVVGFFFEAVGDFQLDRFTSNPGNKGRILTSGLWKFSRHPNYFGEIVMWWGVFFIALQSSNSLVAMIGPLFVTFLITKVSGIPMLEKKYLGNNDFEEYKKRTSVLIPLPPKN